MLYIPLISNVLKHPFFSAKISAGFPSPAEDHIEQTLDISELLVTNPPATFYLRVTGDSMINAGIFEKDILVVDRSRDAKHGDIVVAQYQSEFTVKRLYCSNGKISLVPENENYNTLNIIESDDFEVFGVVSGIVRQL